MSLSAFTYSPIFYPADSLSEASDRGFSSYSASAFQDTTEPHERLDKRSWNNASAAGPAKIKRQEVMSAYPPAASEGMGRIRYDGQRSPNGSVHA